MNQHAKYDFVDSLSDLGRQLYGSDWKSPLARAIGVSRASLGFVVSRERVPSRDFMEKFSDYVRQEFDFRVAKHTEDMKAISKAGKAAADIIFTVEDPKP